MKRNRKDKTLDRRELLAGMAGLSAMSMVPPAFAQAAQAAATEAAASGKILVILELSGGNDGLNTVVPYGDDAYYRQRPNIGIGCGYENPSYSHFTSMAYWHTAAPNSGDEYGWVGRLADSVAPSAPSNYLVNIGSKQSLAVKSEKHVPVVFDDPNRFMREAFAAEKKALDVVPDIGEIENPSRRFLLDIARGANDASALVRDAWSKYDSPVDYGVNDLDLQKVVALLDAGMPTSLYYVSYRNNSFDTHVFQNNLHRRLLTYTSDAVAGFIRDLERIGRADDVALMIFSEFGRRVPENVSLGTDHGAANAMFVVGNQVKGGHYGKLPSLTELADGDNLAYTTDFRKVYQSITQGWLGHNDSMDLLGGDFGAFDLFS